MIGGRDIIIPIAEGVDAMGVAVRAIGEFWPGTVLEDPEAGETFVAVSYPELSGRDEILAFRDREASMRWEELGADPSLDGTLIHLTRSGQALTVTVDHEPSPQIEAFVRQLAAMIAPYGTATRSNALRSSDPGRG